MLRQPAGDARLTFDGVPSEVKAANDSQLEVLAPPADASNSVYDGLFAPGGVPRAAVVNLTLSSAEEDFVGGPPYMYHAEPSVSRVFPAAGPVDGGTRLTVSGAGFAPQGEAAAGPYPNQEGSDPNTVYSAARLRCLFDASAATPPAHPDALPSGSAPSARNGTRVLCASPPSHDAQPPYLNHGASLGVLPRVVALRIALNGVTGSAASVPFSYYIDATVSAVEPRAGPWGGGTRVVMRGAGFENSPPSRSLALCRFGDVAVPFTIVNDTAGECVAPRRAELAAPPEPTWYLRVHVTLSLNGQDYGPEQDSAAFTYYARPRLLWTWPRAGAGTGGTNVSFAAEGLRMGGAVRAPASGPTAPKCVFGNASSLAWVQNASTHGTVPPQAWEGETRWSFVGGWDESTGSGWCLLPRMSHANLSASRTVAFALAMNGQDIGGNHSADAAYEESVPFVVFPQPSLLAGAIFEAAHTLSAAEAAAAEATAALTPSAGPASGGTRVVIHGVHLTGFYLGGTSACRFGAVADPSRPNITVPILPAPLRPDAAVCIAPSNVLGPILVELTLNGPDFFGAPYGATPVRFVAFAEAQLLAVYPTGGPVAGGTNLRLLGRGLLGGTAAAMLKPARRCELCHEAARGGDDSFSPSRCAGGSGPDGRRVDGGGGYSAAPLTALPEGDAAPSDAALAGGALAVAERTGVAGASCATLATPNGTVPLQVALNGVDGVAAEGVAFISEGVAFAGVNFTFYEQPTLTALALTGGPVAGGSLVTIAGTGFDAFGAVPHQLAWYADGRASNPDPTPTRPKHTSPAPWLEPPPARTRSADGGGSRSHRIVSRCRFGAVESPVLDLSPSHALCATRPQPDAVPRNVSLALNGTPRGSRRALTTAHAQPCARSRTPGLCPTVPQAHRWIVPVPRPALALTLPPKP